MFHPYKSTTLAKGNWKHKENSNFTSIQETKTVACPVCGSTLLLAHINHHLDVGCHDAAACRSRKGSTRSASEQPCDTSTIISIHQHVRHENDMSYLASSFAIAEVPGLFQFADFVSEFEENALLDALDHPAPGHKGFVPASFNGSYRVQKWGMITDLSARKVRPPDPSRGESPLPSFLGDIIRRLYLEGHPWSSLLNGFQPNESNANDYRKARGDRLVAHFDDRQLSGEMLVTISLAGDCVMTFTPGVARSAVRVRIPRRTLQVVTATARYGYTHGIANDDLLTERRVAVVLRQAKVTAG